MKREKIFLLSSKFPPLNDGLSDHTFYLMKSLKQHVNVEVITSESSERIEGSNIKYIVKDWKFLSLYRTLGEYFQQGDKVVVQYVPFMYGKKGGINFSFILFILYLKLFKDVKFYFFCHELHYPFLLDIKSLVMAFSHLFMLIGVSLSSEKIFTSCEKFKTKLNFLTFFPLKRIKPLTVGSNIDMEVLNKDINTNPTVSLFGSMHPSKGGAELLNGICKVLNESNKKVELKYIGLNQVELDSMLENHHKGKILALGKLPEQEVAEAINNSHLGICYFLDGVTTRRGSAIAYLRYGVPLLTTIANDTDSVFTDAPGITYSDISMNSFLNKFKQLIESDIVKEKTAKKKKVEAFYNKHFDWNATSREILNQIKN